MLFWIIFGILSVGFWLIRARQLGGSKPLIQGVEQAFFCAILLFMLSIFGLPMLDLKTGGLIEPSDPGYTKFRFGAFVYLCIVTPIYFSLIYLENRKCPK